MIFKIFRTSGSEKEVIFETLLFKKARNYMNIVRYDLTKAGAVITGDEVFSASRVNEPSQLFDGDIESFLYADDNSNGVVAMKAFN